MGNIIFDRVKKFEELLSNYGLSQYFKRILDNSNYVGPVIFFDLTRKNMNKLMINSEKVDVLSLMFMEFICIYEQMNSFILRDEKNKSMFFSTKEICRLLAGSSGEQRFEWMAVFKGIEPRELVPHCVVETGENLRNDRFSCMHLQNIPDYYDKYGTKIWGVKNYFPEIIFWIMENISNGVHANAMYPLMFKNETALSYPPKTVLWHKL